MTRPDYSLALLNQDIRIVAAKVTERVCRPGFWSIWTVEGQDKPRMRFHGGAGA